MGYLIDTNIAVDLRDERPSIIDHLADLSKPYALSLITVVELEGGVAADSTLRDRRRSAVNRLFAGTTVLPFDNAVVAAYKGILLATPFSRRRILDRLIAATALVHDLTLVTINGADFRDIPGLKLEVWPMPSQ